MQETVNQEVTENSTQEVQSTQEAESAQAAGAAQEAPKERTFTQAEVNAMIEGRLSRASEAAKAELQKMTEKAEKLQKELYDMKEADSIRTMRDKVAGETGVPVNLLTEATEEACRKQAEAIREYATPKYPTVKDGGEATVEAKGSTREQFAAWMEANRK